MKLYLVRVLVVVAISFSCTPAFAQWLKYPTAGVPRTGNGKFNPSAPAPRTPDGKPDFSATWDGDTLVVNRERIRRPDFGHLQVEVTVDDPKAYTKPWTVTLKQRLAVDTELVDEICLENEKSAQRMK
jgi:hypothetical protein